MISSLSDLSLARLLVEVPEFAFEYRPLLRSLVLVLRQHRAHNPDSLMFSERYCCRVGTVLLANSLLALLFVLEFHWLPVVSGRR